VTGRHARRARLPFAVVVVALLALIGGGVLFVGARGGPATDATRAAVRYSGASHQTPAGAAPAGTELGGVVGATTATEEPKGRIVIHGTGDVSLDPGYIPAFRSYGYDWAWSGLGGLFRRDDLTVINLECPATDLVDPESKEFVFRCDPASLPIARQYGVEVANLSNNHAYDQGPDGLLDTLKRVRAAGLVPVGAGVDEDAALKPALFDIKGWKIAVLGFDEVLDPVFEVATADKPGTAAGHDFSLMLRAVRAAAKRADIVVVTIHWGIELDTQPRSYQVSEAHQLIDAGADVIFGHHPHRLQPLSVYRGRPIFWSLGNFVWPHLSTAGSTTAVAQVTITPKGRFVPELLPAYIVSSGHPVLR
jgi:poly-gamma-glutamate capsule biosynthesis protein CapA/YwtB (metallophosphatase superfamily)